MDILSNFVLTYDELNTYCQPMINELLGQLVEETCLVLWTAFKNRLKKEEKNDVKQCWIELEFYDTVIKKYESEKAKKVVSDCFTAMKALHHGDGKQTGEIFNEKELASKKKLIRNNKFKYQHNFDVLLH